MMAKKRRNKTWVEIETALSELLDLEPHSAARALPELATRLKGIFHSARAYAQGRELSQHASLNALLTDLTALVTQLKDLRANGSLPEANLQLVFDANWGDFLSAYQPWDAIDLVLPRGELPKKAPVRIRLDALDRKPAVLIRPLDEATVVEYLELASLGTTFPPIEVTCDEQHLYCDNGQHRAEVHRRLGNEWVDAICRWGSYEESVYRAAGSDKAVGRARAREDKRRAVRLVLEIQQFQCLPSTRIATLTGTSHTFVDALKDELGLARNRKHSKKAAPTHQQPLQHPLEEAQCDPEARAARKPEASSDPEAGDVDRNVAVERPANLEAQPEAQLSDNAPEPEAPAPDCNVAVAQESSLEGRPKREAGLSVDDLLELVTALPPDARTRFWGNAPAPIVPRATAAKKTKPGLWNAVEEIMRHHMEAAMEEVAGRLDYEFGDRVAAHSFRGHDAENLLRHLLVAQRALFDIEIVRIRGLLREVPGLGLLSKPQPIYAACKTLGIPAPRKGHIDLDKARRAMRILVAELHPDRNGGQRIHEGRYQEVVEAYAAIRAYAEKVRVQGKETST